MNITIFNKRYWVRHFSAQEYIDGYAVTTHSDFVASLNVHPMGANQMQALPEGERMVKRLEAHGTDVLVAADETSGQKGDLLWYHGRWYECTSAQLWDHTILNHWNYQFVLVPEDASNSIDVSDPPTTDPSSSSSGGDCCACDGCEINL